MNKLSIRLVPTPGNGQPTSPSNRHEPVEIAAIPLLESQNYNRRLLAIMFTDIKDYAKMMNADERRAVRLVGMHNRLMQEEIKAHGGLVAEIIGDAFVATFSSAVRSVECGLSVQKKLAEYNQQ